MIQQSVNILLPPNREEILPISSNFVHLMRKKSASFFVCELFEKLGTEIVDITKESIEITAGNVIEMLIQHEKL